MTRKTVLKGSWRRTMASAMALVFTYSTLAAPVAEANFWAERRKFARLPQAATVPATVQMPSAMLSAETALPNGERSISLPALRSLPAAYADVQTIHQAGADRPWVILLQDVHDVASAQKNIAAALAHLQEASGAPLLVGLEGAAGGFDLQRFRAFRNRRERDDVFGYLLDASHITGAEYFGLTAAQTPRFLGVEDADLYRLNVQAYRRSAAQKAAFAAELLALRARAAVLSLELLDEDLRAYEDLSARHHAGAADLASFLTGLHALSPDQPGFAQVRLFLDALALEKSLDMAQVETERLSLLERLAARLAQEKLAGLLEASLAYRMGRLSAGAYYRDLRATAADAGLDMAAFPAFEIYVRYAQLAEKIDASLYPQIEAFRRAVGDTLVLRPDQRRLLDILDDVRLMEKLTRHELGANEWDHYRGRKADVRLLPARLAALEKVEPRGELRGLDAFEDFYAHAFARNEALVAGLHSALRTSHSALAVLVAGGFHTPGVQGALRARGLNYAVLRPRLGALSGRGSEYLDVYAAEPTPLDRMLLGEKVFLAPTGSLAFRDLAELGHGERTRSLFSLLYGLLSAVRGLAFRPELQQRLGSDLDVTRRGGKWSLLLRRGSRGAAFEAQVSADALAPAGISGRAGTLNFSLSKSDAPRQSFFLQWRAAALLLLAVAFPGFASTARAQLVDGQVQASKSENPKQWLKRLGHKDEAVRDEAVRRLSSMAAPPWAELIKRLLRSKNPLEQVSVARVLENLADPRGLAALRTVARQTEDPDVAAASARALAKLGVPGALALLDIGDEAAMEELSLLGATPFFQEAVSATLAATGAERQRLIRLLGNMDNPDAAGTLVALLDAADDDMAAIALGSLTTLFGGHKDAVTAALSAASARGQTTAIRAWVLLDFNGLDLSVLPAGPDRRFLRAAVEFSRRSDYATDAYRQDFARLSAEAEAYVRSVMGGGKAELEAKLIKPAWAERDANFANLAAAVAFTMQGRLAPFRPNPFGDLLRRIAQGAHVTDGYDNINSDFLMGGVYASKLSGMRRVIADLGHELGHNYLLSQKEYPSGGLEHNAIHEAVGDVFEFAMLQSLGLLEPADVDKTLKDPMYCSVCAKKEVNSAAEQHDAARSFLLKLVSVSNAHGRPVDWVRVAADVQGMRIPSHMTFEQWAVRITFGILDTASAERLSREWATPPVKPAPSTGKVLIPSRQALEAFFRHFAKTAPAVAIFLLLTTLWAPPIQARPFGGFLPEWSFASASFSGLVFSVVALLVVINAAVALVFLLRYLFVRPQRYSARFPSLAAAGMSTLIKPGALASLPVVVLGGILWTAQKGTAAVRTIVDALFPDRAPPAPRRPARDFRVKVFFENHAEGEHTRRFLEENMPYLTDVVLEIPDDLVPVFQAVSNGRLSPAAALDSLERYLYSSSYKSGMEAVLNVLHRSRRRIWGEASAPLYAATEHMDDHPQVDADAAFMMEPNRNKFLKAYRAVIRRAAEEYSLRDQGLKERISRITTDHPAARIGVVRGAIHTAFYHAVVRDFAAQGEPVLRKFFAQPMRFWLTDQLIRRVIFGVGKTSPRDLLRSYIGRKLMSVASSGELGGLHKATHVVDRITARLSLEDFSVLTLFLSGNYHASLDDERSYMTPSGKVVSLWPQTHAPRLIVDWLVKSGKMTKGEASLFREAVTDGSDDGTAQLFRTGSQSPQATPPAQRKGRAAAAILAGALTGLLLALPQVYTALPTAFPVLSSVLATMLATFSADLLVQKLITRTPVDRKRLAYMALLGAALGLFFSFFYGALNSWAPFAAPIFTTLARLVVDPILLAPALYPFIMLFTGLFRGMTFRAILADIRKKAWPAIQSSWVLWIPAQFINFYLIPPAYWVLFFSVLDVPFVMFVSWIVHAKGEAMTPLRLLSKWFRDRRSAAGKAAPAVEPVRTGRSWTVKGAALFVFAAITFGAAAPDYFAFGLIALSLVAGALIVVHSVKRSKGQDRVSVGPDPASTERDPLQRSDLPAPHDEQIRVALLQNYPLNVTGKMIAAHLRSRGVRVDLYQAWAGNLPNWEHYDAIIGSGSAYNPREHLGEPWLESEMNLIRQAQIPILGVCFTHQLIAEAFSNGRTRKAYEYPVYTGPNQVVIDKNDPLFKGLPRKITVAEAHGDEVSTVPDEMIVTAGSEMTRVEAMRHRERPIYSVQFHPEHSEMMGAHGLPNKHGLKVLDNFLDIVTAHRREKLGEPTRTTARRSSRLLAALAAILLGIATPVVAGDIVVRGEDGKPKLNLPPLYRSTNEEGIETSVDLKSRNRSLDLVASRRLNRWFEGSVFAGAHRPPADLRGDGPSVGWHVGIGFRIVPEQPRSTAPRREDTSQADARTGVSEVLRIVREYPDARTGVVRGGGRTAVWVDAPDQVILISGKDTFYSGVKDVRAAAGFYLGTSDVDVLDAEGKPLPVQAPPTTSTAPGPGASLWVLPFAVFGLMASPTPASAAGVAMGAAALDHSGFGLLALGIAVLAATIYRKIRRSRLALMAVVALGLSTPSVARDWVVRGEDGKPRLNLPPIVRTTHEDGYESVVAIRSRKRSLDLVASKPLNSWLEGSLYAGAHSPRREIRGSDGPRVEPHVGIEFKVRLGGSFAPARKTEERSVVSHDKFGEILKAMRSPGARAGTARSGSRSVVWVATSEEVVLIDHDSTVRSGTKDVRAALTLFFMGEDFTITSGNVAEPSAETAPTPGPGAALKAVPLAALGLFALPTPAEAADLTLRAAAADYLGFGLIALAVIAVLVTVLYKTGATTGLRERIASAWKKLKDRRDGSDDSGPQGPGTGGGRPDPIVPPARKNLLMRFDEKGLSAAEKLSQSADLLAAWAVLDDVRHPRANGDPSPASASDVSSLFNDLNDSSIKLLDTGTIARHERTLLALQSLAAQISREARVDETLARKRYAQNATNAALLLGDLSKVSPELAEAVRPVLFGNLLSLRKKLSTEAPDASQADALELIQQIGAESAGLSDADDIRGRVLQISDVLGDSVSDPDYIAALARQLPKEGDETRAALVVTDNESALRDALQKAGVEAGRNVAIRAVDSLPAPAVRRDASGRLESIDVAALPGATDALAKIRIFTRTPALWWLGNIDTTRREAMVEFLLWITRDAAFRLTPARLEDALRAQKTLEIQA